MSRPAPLLDSPAAVEHFNAAGQAAMVITCDHASNLIPADLAGLGLDAAALGRHIAWDIGAAVVARRLAETFDAPLLLSTVSRLVIDCNRAVDDPTLICQVSDGTIVPGNRGLDGAAIATRVARFHAPYHAAIASALDQAAARAKGAAPVFLSVHSFTPEMKGFQRPWDIGVLWDRDPRLARPLMAALRAEGLTVGDNEPYTAQDGAGFTMRHHAANRGFPHVMVEIRQDLVSDAAGQALWAERLGRILGAVLAAGEPYAVEHH